MTLIFLGTVALVALLFVFAIGRAGRATAEPPAVTRRWVLDAAAGVVVWLLLTGLLAVTGRLQSFTSFPPPLLMLVGLSTLLTFGLACSPLGSRLVLGIGVTGLVGFQAFRIAVEIFLAQMYHAGTIPMQMTIEGRNFDMLSGASALIVAWLAARGRLPRWGLLLWNVVGLGLLLNIVVISMLSMPVPFRVFMNEPANTFVTQAPYVWLPVFLVQAALFGHLLVFRLMWQERRQAAVLEAKLV